MRLRKKETFRKGFQKETLIDVYFEELVEVRRNESAPEKMALKKVKNYIHTLHIYMCVMCIFILLL